MGRFKRGPERLAMAGRKSPRGAVSRGLSATFSALLVGIALYGLRVLPAAAQPAPDEGLRLGPMELLTDTSSFIEVGGGVYDIIGNAHRNETAGADVEFRYGKKLFFVGPAVGVIGDLHGGGMIYAAFYSDFALGPVIITPLAGLGAWRHGGGNDEDLGGTFQFRLSLAASYQFANRSRLGLRFGHISNADIHRRNPGENDLMLTYGLPLSF